MNLRLRLQDDDDSIASRPETWRSVVLLNALGISLKLFGTGKTLRALSLVPRRAARVFKDHGYLEAERLRESIEFAKRRCWLRADCLERSLALWLSLAIRGIESDVRLGVRQNQGAIEAHSWVEIDGVNVAERGDTSSKYPNSSSLFEVLGVKL